MTPSPEQIAKWAKEAQAICHYRDGSSIIYMQACRARYADAPLDLFEFINQHLPDGFQVVIEKNVERHTFTFGARSGPTHLGRATEFLEVTPEFLRDIDAELIREALVKPIEGAVKLLAEAGIETKITRI